MYVRIARPLTVEWPSEICLTTSGAFAPTVACWQWLARVSWLSAESYTYFAMGFPVVRVSLSPLRVPLRPVLHRLLSVRWNETSVF
jgi:hypothetical protein